MHPANSVAQDLNFVASVVPKISGEEDRRHAPAAELALDPVSAGKGGGELAPEIGHQAVPATSFWNRGFFRSGSNVGSTLSQPGER